MKRQAFGIQITNELILKLAALFLTGGVVSYTGTRPAEKDAISVGAQIENVRAEVKGVDKRLERIEERFNEFMDRGRK